MGNEDKLSGMVDDNNNNEEQRFDDDEGLKLLTKTQMSITSPFGSPMQGVSPYGATQHN